MAAAAQGAIEGLNEGMSLADGIREDAEASIRLAGQTARAAIEEGRAQAQTPEMRELGHDLQRAGQKTAGAARSVADKTTTQARGLRDAATGRVEEFKAAATGHAHEMESNAITKAGSAAHTVGDAAVHAAHRARETYESAEQTLRRAAEEVKVRAEAVQETGKRAVHAPPKIGREVGQSVKSHAGALGAALGIYALYGIIGATFAVVTVILVAIMVTAWFNVLFGAPWGVTVTAILFTLGLVVAWIAMRGYQASAKDEAKEHMKNAKDEVRHVTAPVRSAFGRGRPGS